VHDLGEVAKAGRGVKVVGAQLGFTDGQGALVQGAGAVQVALGA
jgi:hypothetical protein